MTKSKPTTPRDERGRGLEDPFAITSSGIALLNIQNFDDIDTPNDAVRRALLERTPIFIGIPMNAREVRFVLNHLADLWHEPAARVIGSRQRRAKR